MKTTIKSLVLGAIVLMAASAHADASKLASCELQVAAKGASSMATVKFSESQMNSVGAFERKASVGSITFTLGQAGQQTYMTIQDDKQKTYLSSAFEKAAFYGTPAGTIQVVCK
jgi:hypothetical protein